MMTREETKKVLMSIQAAYPNFRVPNKTVAVNVWDKALKEYSYSDVSTALMVYIKTNTSGFAPSPGQIIDKIHLADRAAELGENEAWAMVAKAIRRGTYYAGEEFQKLPPAVKKAVGSPDNIRSWAKADEQDTETVIQSNFMRSYRAEIQRRREYVKLPKKLRDMIAEASVGMIGVTERSEE